MKKVISSMLFIIMMFFLVSCKKETIEKEGFVETNFTNMSKEYKVKNQKVDLYFEDKESIPYIDIIEFVNLLDGLYYSDEFEFVKKDNKLDVSILIIDEEDKEVEYKVEIDFDNDYIHAEDIDFFEYYIRESSVDYGKGLVSLEPIYKKGSAVKYDLKKYGFDLIIKEDMYLVPLVIANLIFNQNVYFDLYYNGTNLYGIDTADVSGSELKKILKSNENKNEIPTEVKKSTYDYLAFMIDYFYGLKEERSINSGYEFLKKYENEIKNENASYGIFNVVKGLDDLHTAHVSRGYYNNPNLEDTYPGGVDLENVSKFNRGMQEVVDSAARHFGVYLGQLNLKDYELIDNGKTAVIYLLEFEVDTPEAVFKIIDKLDSKVENIIIDLSLNTGGNIGSVLRILTKMTNKEVWYHAKNPLNNATISYGQTTNEKVYDKYNYFVKTSSVTFSAANLMASIAKDLDIPVIGQKSSGGASAIMPIVLPEGSIIFISSSTVLTRKDEKGDYVSVEYGIDVDYPLNNLYSETEINRILNSIK